MLTVVIRIESSSASDEAMVVEKVGGGVLPERQREREESAAQGRESEDNTRYGAPAEFARLLLPSSRCFEREEAGSERCARRGQWRCAYSKWWW